jgi:pre-mRNA-processing factor 6
VSTLDIIQTSFNFFLNSEARAKRGEEPEYDPDQFQDPDNEVGLFSGQVYEQDDEEADRIYDEVDKNMDARRRARRSICSNLILISKSHYVLTSREAREKAEREKERKEKPKLQQQFADLKRGLSAVSDAEWESIPEVGNLTRRKRQRQERTFVVPDSVLVGDRAKAEYENALDPMQQEVRFVVVVVVFLCDCCLTIYSISSQEASQRLLIPGA